MVPLRLNIDLPHYPEIPLLELKTGTQTDTFMSMFITTLFIIALKWETLKCPPNDKWIHKLYIHTIKYYVAIEI